MSYRETVTPAPGTTVDATPLDLSLGVVPPDSLLKIAATVVGQASDGTSASFTLVRTVKRVGTGPVAAVGNAIAPIPEKDTGALTWTAAFALVDPQVVVRVTGALATTIRWLVIAELLVSR